jgi:hypothetical protein
MGNPFWRAIKALDLKGPQPWKRELRRRRRLHARAPSSHLLAMASLGRPTEFERQR